MSADNDLKEEVALNGVRLLMMRDIIARLLAYVAMSEPDPEVVLRDFFEAGDTRIDRSGLLRAGAEARMLAAMQTDKDWIVEAARRIIPPKGKAE